MDQGLRLARARAKREMQPAAERPAPFAAATISLSRPLNRSTVAELSDKQAT
jgi:hypothetical protein